MTYPTISTNDSTICPTCQTYPLAVINGRQVDGCAYCYARSIRALSESLGDYKLNGWADILDAAIEISVTEELARR